MTLKNAEVGRRAYSPREVEQLLGISKNLTYKLIESGELKSVRAGKRILVPAWAVEDFLKKA